MLIVELVIACLGAFSGFLKFDANSVQEAIITDYMEAPDLSAVASDFRRGNFSKSIFTEGMFDYAIFDRTSFRATSFRYTDFRQSQFDGANFSGVDLSNIVVDQHTVLPPAVNKSVQPTAKAATD